MRWVELSVEAGIEAVEAVSEILSRLERGVAVRPTRLVGAPGDELAARPDSDSPYIVTAHIPADHGWRAATDRTERALWHLQAFGLGPVGELRRRVVDDTDWADGWRADYAAQRIGRVVIVPSWVDAVAEPGDVVVRLDPGMAFGTGLHPTTRACLLAMQDLGPMAGTVLDVGCGSGILAISALKLGASHATAIDTDPVAVEVASANAALNGVADQLDVRHGPLETAPSERYGVIVANLVASVLVDLSGRLADHLTPGGRLVASGIIDARAAEVVSALHRVGLGLTRRIDTADWVTVVASAADEARNRTAGLAAGCGARGRARVR